MIRAVVLDVEGTTSSLDYVRDHLFRYAYDRLPAWIAAHGDDPEVIEALLAVAVLARRPAAGRDEIVAVLREWIDHDAKLTPLKTIQGLIWSEGFRAGQLRAHIYPEVPAALARWRRQGLTLHVFSSGSVAAQQAWFRHTSYGDMTDCLTCHFDTANAGAKQSPESYRAITRSIGTAASATVFLSDLTAELDAARSAGWQTVLVQRPGAAPAPTAGHLLIQDFDQLDLTTSPPARRPVGGRPGEPTQQDTVEV